jgi:hypothetical protein
MYRTVDASTWNDKRVEKLNSNGKLLFLYLITNPHTHVSGIYCLPKLYIQHETGLSRRKIDTLLHTLSGLGLARYDDENEVVWVSSMLRYQGKGEKNHRSAAKHVAEDLHKSFLINNYLAFYPEVKQYVSRAFLDTLSHKVSGLAPPEQEQEQEQNTPSLSPPRGDGRQSKPHISLNEDPTADVQETCWENLNFRPSIIQAEKWAAKLTAQDCEPNIFFSAIARASPEKPQGYIQRVIDGAEQFIREQGLEPKGAQENWLEKY